MMNNLFTKHAKENGHSGYFSHMWFALTIGCRLLVTSGFFMLHALLPFVPMPNSLSLEKTTQFLIVKNHGTL
tara:strand:+ start:351 stop:566 length:216 start_codon:yes stop_codon:yes gene_type:complete